MSPRYSNVTSSIRGYDYTICITQSQIHLFKPTQRTSKSAPKFLPESQDENVCQPLHKFRRSHNPQVDHQNIHQVDHVNIPLSPQINTCKTYIKCSQILKDSIR